MFSVFLIKIQELWNSAQCYLVNNEQKTTPAPQKDNIFNSQESLPLDKHN
jgi:hypothetical protein